MKSKSLFLAGVLGSLTLSTGALRAQQALKTDTAGNPTTAFNLGGGNVTGTLATARLPAGIGAPVVQIITQTQGSLSITPGTTIALLKAPLTGTLNLTLPAANAYPTGRVLVVVDPAGYSNQNRPVNVSPAGSDLLNNSPANAGATETLAGTGASVFYPDGVSRWNTGQSYLRAPSTTGLTLTGPATSSTSTVLSVRNAANSELFTALGDGNVNISYLNALNLFTSDASAIYTDGEGTLTVNGLVATEGVSSGSHDLTPTDPASAGLPDSGIRLYAGTDGKLHARTGDGVDYTLSWTTNP